MISNRESYKINPSNASAFVRYFLLSSPYKSFAFDGLESKKSLSATLMGFLCGEEEIRTLDKL
jgi:hypothetical protein